MIKKLSILIAILTAFALQPSAQQTGSWKSYPYYSGAPSQIAVIPSGTVYYVNNGRLYSYDAANETFRDFSSEFGGRQITFIKYNPDGGYLFCACEGGDISLVADDESVTRLSDIADAMLRVEKTINDVAFKDNEIFVGTKFGIVVFDTKTNTVTRSCTDNRNVSGITVMGDNLLVNFNGVLDIGPASAPLLNWGSEFRRFGQYSGLELETIDTGAGVIAMRQDNGTTILTLDPAAVKVTDTKTVSGKTGRFVNADNAIAGITDQAILRYNTDGTSTTLAKLPAKSAAAGLWDTSMKKTWIGTADGIACYDFSVSPATSSAAFLPADNVGVRKVAFITPSPDGRRIYVSNEPAGFRPANDGGWGSNTRAHIYKMEGSDITDVSPVTLPEGGTFARPSLVAEDPVDPSRYFVGSSHSGGIAVVKDGKITTHFTTANSPLVNNRASTVAFDTDGNLIVFTGDGDDNSHIIILPKAKVSQQDLSGITSADWTDISAQKMLEAFINVRSLVCKKTPLMFFYGSWYSYNLLAVDRSAGLSNFSSYRLLPHDSFTDQDGRALECNYIYSVAEDNNGHIWFSTPGGIYYMDTADLNSLLNGTMTAHSVKVPRNDGTGYADYLLDGETINWISVDANNNKWLATDNSGIYCVSPDGTEILTHLDTDNSPLPVNQINTIFADPLSSQVYVGTNHGLMAYTSNYAPAAGNYDEVYAYPNPVRPDYTGWITVVNLMDNSLVKIADNAGNVVFSGRSTGGKFIWDGCNSAGRRVKSGVYYVLASQNADGSSSGAVTKILILN